MYYMAKLSKRIWYRITEYITEWPPGKGYFVYLPNNFYYITITISFHRHWGIYSFMYQQACNDLCEMLSQTLDLTSQYIYNVFRYTIILIH